MELGLIRLSELANADQLLFWGKIITTSSPYYIAVAIDFKGNYAFPHKKFYFRYPPINTAKIISSFQNYQLSINTIERRPTISTLFRSQEIQQLFYWILNLKDNKIKPPWLIKMMIPKNRWSKFILKTIPKRIDWPIQCYQSSRNARSSQLVLLEWCHPMKLDIMNNIKALSPASLHWVASTISDIRLR